jgi:hypothetical protein
MKRKLAMLGSAAVAAGVVAGCGGSNGTPPPPSPPPTTGQMLDTAAVLAQAKSASDETEPYAVNDGAVVLTDTSETTEPVMVDGT